MKKIIAIAGLAIAGFSVTACGSAAQSTAEPHSSASPVTHSSAQPVATTNPVVTNPVTILKEIGGTVVDSDYQAGQLDSDGYLYVSGTIGGSGDNGESLGIYMTPDGETGTQYYQQLGSMIVSNAGNSHVAGPNFIIDLHVFNVNGWHVTATQVAQRVHGTVFSS